MEAPLEYKTTRRKLCGIAAILGLLIATARFAVGRLEFILLSDILLADSLLAKLFPLLQSLLMVFGFALFYSFTAVFCHRFGFAKAIPFICLTVGISVYRSLLSLLGKIFIDGVSEYEFFVSVLPLQILSLILELAQYLLVLFIIWLVLRLTVSLPRSILFASLSVLLVNVASRIVYDVDYGLPSSTKEVFQIVGAYTSDVLLYGVLLFFAMRFLAAWAEKIMFQKA